MSSQISLLLSLALLLIMVVGFFVLQKRHKHMQQQFQQQQLQCQSLTKQLQMVVDGAYGLGQQLAGIEGAVKVRNSAQQDNDSGGDISLRQAIELARKGATVDELIDICGLSRGEAELLSTMHKQPSA